MLHLSLTPIPQFASLTCSVDMSMEEDDFGSKTLANLVTVVSPFATLSSNVAQEMLLQLHTEQLHSRENSKSTNDSYTIPARVSSMEQLNTNRTKLRSNFQAKYDKYNNQRQRQLSGDTPIRTFTPTNIQEGYFIIYTVIQEPAAFQRLTAIFLQSSMSTSLFSTCIQPTKRKPLISSWVLSMCFSSGVSFGTVPNNSYIQTYLSRFIQCYHELIQLQASMGVVSPSDQLLYLHAMLISILMDDEYIKTKEAESVELNPDAILSKALVDGTGFFKSTKGGLSMRRLVFKRDRSKLSTTDGDLPPIHSTALISTSASSSEIAKIVADQSQILSFVEKNVNLKGYHHKSSNTKTSTKNDSTAKIQIKALQKAGKSKVGSHAKADYAGFECMEPYINPVQVVDDDDVTIYSTISSDFSTLSLSSSLSRESSITTKSSGSIKVPTLQGSSRDSSSISSNQRKNRLASVATTNNQMKGMSRFNGEGPSITRSPSPSPRLNASPKDPSIKSHRGGISSSMDSTNFNPFTFSPDGKTVDGDAFMKDTFHSKHDPEENNSVRTIAQLEERRKNSSRNEIIVTFAINEDLSYNYRNSSLISMSIQGVIQIQATYPSDYKSPLIITLRDPSGHIQSIDRMSAGVKTNSVDDGVYRYNVSLPDFKEYVRILKYNCTMKLKPNPLVRFTVIFMSQNR